MELHAYHAALPIYIYQNYPLLPKPQNYLSFKIIISYYINYKIKIPFSLP
jgi:hypothetical protein